MENSNSENKPPNLPPAGLSPGTKLPKEPPKRFNMFALSRWLPILLIVIIGAVLASVLWEVWGEGGLTGRAEVVVWLDTNGNVKSGSESTFTIVYENRGPADIQELELQVFYPDNFQFIESFPESLRDKGQTFVFPQIAANQSGSISVTGIFSGSPEEIKSLRVQLFYKLKNSAATYTAESSTQIRLQPSDFNLRITAPTEVNNFQSLAYNIDFQNLSDQELQNMQIRLVPPPGFIFFESSVEPKSPEVWEYGQISVGEEKELSVTGTLSGNVGDIKTMQVELGLEQGDGSFSVRSRAFITTRILKSALSVVHKTDAKEDFVFPGQTLRYDIEYANTGSLGMNNTQIILAFEGDVIDLSSIDAKGGALVGNKIIWNASGHPDLEVVHPGSSGIIKMQFKIKDNISALRLVNPFVKTRVFSESAQLPQPVEGNALELQVSGRLVAQEDLAYNSGVTPPEVGELTEYRIRLQIQGLINQFKDGVWIAFLNVPTVGFVEGSLTSPQGADDVSVDLSSGKVLWRFDKLAPYESKEIEFLVNVTPSPADQNDEVQILRSPEVSAVDEFIGRKVIEEQLAELKTEKVQ